MCGIAGVWHRNNDRVVDAGVLAAMSATLAHRGPDDSGQYIKGSLGLAHRRLSIIDLSLAGHQPMSTPDGRFTLTYNGEIYNYHELREKYCQYVNFKSSSDTEVLLNVLALKGEAVLDELRGMFALALWDEQAKRLLLARDPFGKKPLYYAEVDGTLIFASEIKACLAYDGIKSELDVASLAEYLLYEYVPAPNTGLRQVKQLELGQYLVATADSIKIKSWWKPTYRPKNMATESDVLAEFDEKLGLAVERRMISDVPVGLLLSGGLDSTSIGWYMKQQATSAVHSFSVSFEEKSFDEGSFAKQAAESLGMIHHDVAFGLDEFHQTLQQLTDQMDIPLGDASLLPTYEVSKLARQDVTVALDGDGSDELLGGYGTFQAAEVAERMPKLGDNVYKWGERLIKMIPTSHTDFSFDFKAKSFWRGLSYSLPRRNQVWLGSFNEKELAQVLTANYQAPVAEVFEPIDKLAQETGGWGVADQVSKLTVHHYLQNDILTKLDRATMLVSLEARTPFLDVDLAEFLMKLPTKYKQKKYLLKKLMEGRIPTAIIDRPKKGFGLPLGLWLKGPLFDWAQTTLNSEKLAADGILVPSTVSRLLVEHRQGKADHRKKLWTLLAWQLWYDRWIR